MSTIYLYVGHCDALAVTVGNSYFKTYSPTNANIKINLKNKKTGV